MESGDLLEIEGLRGLRNLGYCLSRLLLLIGAREGSSCWVERAKCKRTKEWLGIKALLR
jgi:hypothetical protein